ncbi:glycoside hydrolase superfamily [Mycena olivaceomarginata]|nr:glycoside hydrolase superfamily [Mycena olivaceomarginata]
MLPPFLAVVSALILVSVSLHSPLPLQTGPPGRSISSSPTGSRRRTTPPPRVTRPCAHTAAAPGRGITNHLGYIQDMGFDAVWISPVVKNVDGTAYGDGYHGRVPSIQSSVIVYWSADMDALSPHFGPAADLKNLSDALHARGMYLMLDFVVNHMASPPNNTNPSVSNPLGIDFSALSPFKEEADFHKQCFIQDFTNQTEVEQCWLGDANLPLADVNTEDAGVVAALCENIKGLVKTYGVDGRAHRHGQARPARLLGRVQGVCGGFHTGRGLLLTSLSQVETDDPAYAVRYLGPLDAVLDYPAFYNLTRAFSSTSGDLSRFASVPALPALASSSSSSLSPASASTSASAASSSASPAPLLLTAAFLENHDQPRFPSLTADGALRKNAMEQGYEGGGDPANREALWLSGYATDKPGVALVTTLNKVRKHAMKANPEFVMTPVCSLDQPIRHSHPHALQAAPPHPPHQTWAPPPPPPSPRGASPQGCTRPATPLVDVLACAAVMIASSGETVVQAQGGEPQVLIPASMLSKAEAGGGARRSRRGLGARGRKTGRVGAGAGGGGRGGGGYGDVVVWCGATRRGEGWPGEERGGEV